LLEDPRTDVNLTGKLGYTALDYACRDNGRLEIVYDLINHGAKITATTMECALYGYRTAHCEESVVKLVYDKLAEQKIPSGLTPEIEAVLQGDSRKLILLAKEILQEKTILI
jgi:ankyrin repeat protein